MTVVDDKDKMCKKYRGRVANFVYDVSYIFGTNLRKFFRWLMNRVSYLINSFSENSRPSGVFRYRMRLKQVFRMEK